MYVTNLNVLISFSTTGGEGGLAEKKLTIELLCDKGDRTSQCHNMKDRIHNIQRSCSTQKTPQNKHTCYIHHRYCQENILSLNRYQSPSGSHRRSEEETVHRSRTYYNNLQARSLYMSIYSIHHICHLGKHWLYNCRNLFDNLCRSVALSLRNNLRHYNNSLELAL